MLLLTIDKRRSSEGPAAGRTDGEEGDENAGRTTALTGGESGGLMQAFSD